ncbi:hypothetical protein DL93DRAFT_62397 [Clavulina sp. PMI_390]|nr:hypothetical protein DL93DRAFT_62397 [Clavulina sp. PMI_390]
MEELDEAWWSSLESTLLPGRLSSNVDDNDLFLSPQMTATPSLPIPPDLLYWNDEQQCYTEKLEHATPQNNYANYYYVLVEPPLHFVFSAPAPGALIVSAPFGSHSDVADTYIFHWESVSNKAWEIFEAGQKQNLYFSQLRPTIEPISWDQGIRRYYERWAGNNNGLFITILTPPSKEPRPNLYIRHPRSDWDIDITNRPVEVFTLPFHPNLAIHTRRKSCNMPIYFEYALWDMGPPDPQEPSIKFARLPPITPPPPIKKKKARLAVNRPRAIAPLPKRSRAEPGIPAGETAEIHATPPVPQRQERKDEAELHDINTAGPSGADPAVANADSEPNEGGLRRSSRLKKGEKTGPSS